MPLKNSATYAAFEYNLRLLLKENKSLKQALAICFSIQKHASKQKDKTKKYGKGPSQSRVAPARPYHMPVADDSTDSEDEEDELGENSGPRTDMQRTRYNAFFNGRTPQQIQSYTIYLTNLAGYAPRLNSRRWARRTLDQLGIVPLSWWRTHETYP